MIWHWSSVDFCEKTYFIHFCVGSHRKTQNLRFSSDIKLVRNEPISCRQRPENTSEEGQLDRLAVVILDSGLAVDELDVGEREVTDLAAQLALPLAVHRHLGDFDDVADLQSQGRPVVSVGDSGLLHSGIGREFSL